MKQLQGGNPMEVIDIKTAKIRQLNDAFRRSGRGGTAMIADEVHNCFTDAQLREVCQRVMDFDAFTPGDDPYGEHDFGAFDVFGKRVLWKIDYYDPELCEGSDDPDDPVLAGRVLTIMLAEDA
jgi:Protein of unknown function (DUF3768)